MISPPRRERGYILPAQVRQIGKGEMRSDEKNFVEFVNLKVFFQKLCFFPEMM